MALNSSHDSEYRRKYELSRHHAWAGTALLSVLLALRYVISRLPQYVFIPLAMVFIVYILIALVFTYRYRTGLSTRQARGHRVEPEHEDRLQEEVVRERLKLDKKKAKTEAKKLKKEIKAQEKTSKH